MDDLWEDGDDRDFKVALHGVNKVLEPERPSRTDPTYVVREGVSYQLDLDKIWINKRYPGKTLDSDTGNGDNGGNTSNKCNWDLIFILLMLTMLILLIIGIVVIIRQKTFKIKTIEI